MRKRQLVVMEVAGIDEVKVASNFIVGRNGYIVTKANRM